MDLEKLSWQLRMTCLHCPLETKLNGILMIKLKFANIPNKIYNIDRSWTLIWMLTSLWRVQIEWINRKNLYCESRRRYWIENDFWKELRRALKHSKNWTTIQRTWTAARLIEPSSWWRLKTRWLIWINLNIIEMRITCKNIRTDAVPIQQPIRTKNLLPGQNRTTLEKDR